MSLARPMRPRGPYRDPRLVDRQGDVLGLSSLLLVMLMIGAVLAMGALMVGVGRLVPTPAPTSVPTPAPTSVPTPTTSSATVVTPTPAPASVAPSSTLAPGLTDRVLQVAFGDPGPITERGEQIGTVTVESGVYRARIAGVEPRAGRRWLRVSVTYRATEALTYAGSRWSALDVDGRRHRWTGDVAPDPVLGGGTLDAGVRRTGYLVFAVPSDVAIRAVVLQDADARDILMMAIR